MNDPLVIAVAAVARVAETWNVDAWPFNTIEIHRDPYVGLVVSFTWHGIVRPSGARQNAVV